MRVPRASTGIADHSKPLGEPIRSKACGSSGQVRRGSATKDTGTRGASTGETAAAIPAAESRYVPPHPHHSRARSHGRHTMFGT